MPVKLRACRIFRTRLDLDRGLPLEWQNRGSLVAPLIARYWAIDCTGQMSARERPRKIDTPWRKGSVLLCLMCMRITLGV